MTVKRYRFLKLMHGRDSTYIQPRIFSDLSKEKPDIIHVHGFRFFPVYGGIMFTYFSRIPVIATLHHNPQLNVTVFQKLHDRIFLGRLDRLARIIALTEFEKGFLIKTIKKDKITVVPNGVSDTFVGMCDRFLIVRDQIRTNLEVVPSKNIGIILQAMYALSGSVRDNVILITCGPTNDNTSPNCFSLRTI